MRERQRTGAGERSNCSGITSRPLMQSSCFELFAVRRESQTAISFSKFQPSFSTRSSKPRWETFKAMRPSSNASAKVRPSRGLRSTGLMQRSQSGASFVRLHRPCRMDSDVRKETTTDALPQHPLKVNLLGTDDRSLSRGKLVEALVTFSMAHARCVAESPFEKPALRWGPPQTSCGWSVALRPKAAKLERPGQSSNRNLTQPDAAPLDLPGESKRSSTTC